MPQALTCRLMGATGFRDPQGQIKFEFFGFAVSPAHLISEFVEGMYRRGHSQLYVSRGIGITRPPARLNAPPEITVLRLTPPST